MPGPLELHDAVALPRRWTYDALVNQVEESSEPHELWDGQLVMSPTPSFSHQQLVLRFARLLQDWTAPRNLGEVAIAPIDMVLAPQQVTQPDVAFISTERLHVIRRVIQGPADLAVEIVSPGSGDRDRIAKRALYQKHGVREYWIIDPEPQTVEVLHLEPTGYRLAGVYRGTDSAASILLEGFHVALPTLFQGLTGGV